MYRLLALTFAGSALAANSLRVVVPRELRVRQDQSFTPTTSFGTGDTCEDAFGAGYILCGEICYNPGIGQTCCTSGDDYPCPSQSFCLIEGLCCPDGVDPQTCAADNGVELPADFGTSPPATTGSSPEPEPTVASEPPYTQSSAPAVTYPTYTPTFTVTDTSPTGTGTLPTGTGTFPIPGNSTVPVPTGTGAPIPPPPPFTGAGAKVVVGSGALAGVAGLAAMLL
ncbi:MAG: hypothetical protein LQ351_004454 [Letrouitia transgressa]|nr:MAG: hypothetical protein LQ351_004454 [Letrouitia transgressa]